MQADVVDLQQFYQSGLGGWVIQEIHRLLVTHDHAHPHDLIVGLGYSQPFLEVFHPKSRERLALMPAQLGALQESSVPQALCLPSLLPLRNSSVQSLLMVHLLEFVESPKLLLREASRVLHDEGTLVLIVPYRRGLWARSTEQPFGLGVPYSRHQLRILLENNGFAPTHTARCLTLPPIHSAKIRAGLEWLPLVRKLLTPLSGGLIMEAKKSLIQPTPVGKITKIPGLGQWATGQTTTAKILKTRRLQAGSTEMTTHNLP